MNIHIRNMAPADIGAVRRIAEESWHTTYEGLIPREIQDRFLALAYSPSMLKKRCSGQPFYVSEKDGELIGFANFSNVREDGSRELAAIYVLPEAQGQGVGSRLLEHGIRELQPTAIHLNVESGNRIGKTFYEVKGFRSTGEFDDDFDGHFLKTTRMTLQLN